MPQLPGIPIPVNRGMFIILRGMRPPCAQNATVVTPYQLEPTPNFGLLLSFPAGEPVIAPGSAKVLGSTLNGGGSVRLEHSVRLDDHVEVLQTILTGMDSVDVEIGQQVARGDRLGTPADTLLFQAYYSRDFYDPSTINSYFVAQDGFLVYKEGNTLPPAPDLLPNDGTRHYDTSIVSNVVGGVRFFSQ